MFTDEAGYDRPVLKGETVGHGVYLSLPDQVAVDAVFTSAVEAGATVVWEPAGNEWGSYRCRALDIEGYEWSFATHKLGEPQAW